MTLITAEPTVDELQTAIKDRLASITGLRAYATEPDKPNFPCAYPRLVDWTFDNDYDSDTLWHFDIWVLVGLEPGFARAQTWLNPYLSPVGNNSIKLAIDADPHLGGTVSFARVTGGGAYGRVDIAGIAALGASVRVEIQT
ncbi:MAG TPA: hypothetical protein VFB50_10000 [Chloroflexota bacterium]|nr:hypothetical protein [Chloroflexota bacterium]